VRREESAEFSGINSIQPSRFHLDGFTENEEVIDSREYPNSIGVLTHKLRCRWRGPT